MIVFLTGLKKDLNELSDTLKRNSYPLHIIDTSFNKYVNNKSSPNSSTVHSSNNNTRYFKLPYIGYFSKVTESKLKQLLKRFCNTDINIKLVFTSFKIKNFFSAKDRTPDALKSLVVYKFICAGCNSCYIGETSRHLSTRIKEHLVSDQNSHIFKHLVKSPNCKTMCTPNCFEILDSAKSTFDLKLQEAFDIRHKNPELNKQVHHIDTFLTL